MNRQSDSEPARHMTELDWPEQMQRLGTERSVMFYIGGFSAISIAGYTIYRVAVGDWVSAFINAAIFTAMIIPLILARTERWQRVAMPLFGIVITISCIGSALLIGSNGLLWAYLVFWVNTFLLPLRMAVVLNGVAIGILTAHSRLFDSILEQISWTTVALLITAFGLFYAHQMRQQRRMLRKLATHDALTGIGNRRLMQHRLDQAVDEFDELGSPYTLVVLDLDHFKRLNDSHGHEAGDLALRHFAQKLDDALRTQDDIYRMGGEEFVMLLRDMDEEAAANALPDLHRRLSGCIDGPDGPILFSAGAATLRPGEDWSRWLGRADRALYKAKKAGRNTLVMDE
jgi:diguanylate cyclase (GGDEF)-like protein